MHTKFFTLAAGALLCACASSAPQAHEHLARSMAAVRGAEEAGASRVPKAALHLKLAEDQIAQAKNMMADGDETRADRMAIRAYNDAELANAMARSASASNKLASYEKHAPVDIDGDVGPANPGAGTPATPQVELRAKD